MHTCPVCGYDALEAPPADFLICSSCGTEFGLDDEVRTHEELRREWLRRGAEWFSEFRPAAIGWDPYEQLVNAGLADHVASTPKRRWAISVTIDVQGAQSEIADPPPLRRSRERRGPEVVYA